MGFLTSLFGGKKKVFIFITIAALSLMKLNVGKKAEDMAVELIKSGQISNVSGYVVTIDNKPVPAVKSDEIFVYKDTEAANVIVNEIKARDPSLGSRIKVADVEEFAEDPGDVEKRIIRSAKEQINTSYMSKAPVIKGPLTEHALLELNRKACENLGIRTSTFDWRDDRIPSWMAQVLEEAWTKGKIVFDYGKQSLSF